MSIEDKTFGEEQIMPNLSEINLENRFFLEITSSSFLEGANKTKLNLFLEDFKLKGSRMSISTIYRMNKGLILRVLQELSKLNPLLKMNSVSYL